MYGGLFGDLPSTKKSLASDKETTGDKSDAKESQTQQEDTTKQDADSIASKKRAVSVVGNLGNAGTTMAFVPAALRNRKRVNSAAPPTEAPVKIPPAAAPSPSLGPSSLQVVVEQSNAKTTTLDEPIVSHIHSNDTFTDPAVEQEEESEAMRLLHASVVDVYDPHEPNDLLAYWDRKAMERERLALEREAKETLQRQERLRQQLEHERKSLQKSGNMQGILDQAAMGRGRGRGRGVSNLPAWLVQQQKNELDSEKVLEKKPQCTVILSNLTAPGDVDEELADEVKEECEEQCGPVISVVIQDANPPHHPVVQVHVEFGNRADAEKAVRVFHGRKFGQRRITAEFSREM